MTRRFWPVRPDFDMISRQIRSHVPSADQPVTLMHKPMWAVLALLAVAPLSAFAADATPPKPSEEGIPVTDPLVKAKCGGCHQADAKGNLTRISWIRTTPEGWEQAVKRMVRLNGLTLKPGEARQIVHYLA